MCLGFLLRELHLFSLNAMKYSRNSDICGHFITQKNSDGQTKVLYADDAACSLTGLTLEELLISDPLELIKALGAEHTPLNDNCELWILSSSESQETSTMEALSSKVTALEKKLQDATAENQAKSTFLSNMSHDIRTPMNAITGMTSIALSHIDEKSRVQDCLHKINTASTHLMSLINDILDMSRIASGRMTLNEEPFSLADLVHDITMILRPQAIEKEQVFRLDIGQIYEENLIGDTLRLRQVMVNTIGNAIKYTQEGGEIQVHFSQRIDKSQEQPPKSPPKIWLDFVCEDNGAGISQDFLSRIFVPFERVNNSTISKVEGTGLGLAIVKSILDHMNGSITIESEVGKGSCFQVSIPFAFTPQTQETLKLPHGQTVLLAESKEAPAKQIMAYLQDGDMEAIHLKSGMEAVTWLTEALYENHMPCVLLLGQELADMQVLDLASHVRQLAGKDFPIIYVAEADWAQLEYRASRAGVNAFVSCPLFKSRLLTTISSLTCDTPQEQDDYSKLDADYSQYRILLVEDNELNREIATELLSMTGVQVETAENGLLAVEKFEKSPEGYFDLIFMDIQMPIMNGYEAAKNIRSLPRPDAKNIGIVAMTANAFVEDIRLSKEAGMNEHCSKPIDVNRLYEILHNFFKK